MDQQQQNYQNQPNQQPPQTIIIKKGMGFWGGVSIVLSIIFLVCIVVATTWYARVGPLSIDEWRDMNDNVNWAVPSRNSWESDWEEKFDTFDAMDWYSSEKESLNESKREKTDAVIEEYDEKYNALQESFDGDILSANSYQAEVENLEKWKQQKLDEIDKWHEKELDRLDKEYEKEDRMDVAVEHLDGEWTFDETHKSGDVLISESYPQSEISSLRVGMAAAKIKIGKSDDENAHVLVKAGRSTRYRTRFQMGISNGMLTLLQRNKARGDYRVEITLPAKLYERVQLETASGSMYIEDIESDLVVLKSVSGSVDVKAMCNTIRSDSVSGSVNLDLSGANNIRVAAVSGSVDVKTDAKAPHMNINSISGSIDIVLPEDASFAFSIKSTSRVRVFDQQAVGVLSGIIATGEGDVSINSVSGNLEIRGKAMESKPSPATAS